MSIQITEKTIGIWFVALNAGSDWMCGVTELDNGEAEIRYRFRYGKPEDDPFAFKDKKNWYIATAAFTRDDAIKHIRKLSIALALASGGERGEVLMNDARDVEAFMKEFAAQPWAHVKIMDAQ